MPATTPEDPIRRSLNRQRDAITRGRDVLAADPRILAAFLIGSHAAGTADAYSDVDLHCVVADTDVETCLADAEALMTRIAGPLALADRLPGTTGAVAVAADWLRLDLFFHARSGYDPDRYDAVAPLFDHAGLLPPPRTGDAPPEPPWFPQRTVDMFFFFLGNLVAVLGRGETTLALDGLGLVRAQLVALMCAEQGVRRTGGAKRLSPFLTGEQRHVLDTVPGAGPEPAEIIAAHRHLAADFIPRGRALAAATGNPWPEALERATLAHLRRHLGMTLPD
ncbi:nucleotidyltransferase domain-containing protein [Stackebrandtia albiflava]|nr:nucleotidyltransferase domain-containing protein [Stackebrandtia albiflava]